MSYVRFTEAGSHVYVFLSVHGSLECCGCSLAEDGIATNVKTVGEMLAHLDAHRAAGDVVPRFVDERIRDDAEAIAAFIDGYELGESLR